MYTVTKQGWNRLRREHPDYITRTVNRHEHDGKVCNPGDFACFESLFAPGTGTALIFQNIHFQIV